ncbi:hypothetical protein J8273_8568 [Carpediemonas membranifera]|uniref:Uncharacterized protein n=1 Tax=Carpediemonas membranifera TaxID=201153 RepID=A0A8J6AQZ5_9EUKA|nr:hypothetical protein J8273_8568 [Carpediemonas membranifera]|eukprot:KAG9389885.1 hypothetical protein J8273_8568 [Carpediemonas membranifera]
MTVLGGLHALLFMQTAIDLSDSLTDTVVMLCAFFVSVALILLYGTTLCLAPFVFSIGALLMFVSSVYHNAVKTGQMGIGQKVDEAQFVQKLMKATPYIKITARGVETRQWTTPILTTNVQGNTTTEYRTTSMTTQDTTDGRYDGPCSDVLTSTSGGVDECTILHIRLVYSFSTDEEEAVFGKRKNARLYEPGTHTITHICPKNYSLLG